MDDLLAEHAVSHCKRIVADYYDASRNGASPDLAVDRARLVASYLHEAGVISDWRDVLLSVEAYALDRYGAYEGPRVYAPVARGFESLFERVVAVRRGEGVVTDPDGPLG